MVPPRHYDSSSTSVTASRLFSRPLLSSIRFSQSPRTLPLLAAYTFCSSHTRSLLAAFALPAHGSFCASRGSFRLFAVFSIIPFRCLPTLGRLSPVFAFLQSSRTGSLVAAIALSLLAHGCFWGAFHLPFRISSHGLFPFARSPSRFRLFATFNTRSHTWPSFRSDCFRQSSRTWLLVAAFTFSLLTHGRFGQHLLFAVSSHKVSCSSLRLITVSSHMICGCLRPLAVFSPMAAFGQHLFATVPSHTVPCGILRPFEVSPSLRPSKVFCTIRFLQSFHTRPLLAVFAFAYFHTRPLLAAFAFSQSSSTRLLVTALALSQSSGTRLSSHMITFAGVHLFHSLSHTVAFGNNRISQSSGTRLLVAFVVHSCFCRRSPLTQSFVHSRFRQHSPLHTGS